MATGARKRPRQGCCSRWVWCLNAIPFLAIRTYYGESDIVSNLFDILRQEGFLNLLLHFDPFAIISHRTSSAIRIAVLAPLPFVCVGWSLHNCNFDDAFNRGLGSVVCTLCSLQLLWKLLCSDLAKSQNAEDPPQLLTHRYCFFCKRYWTLRDHHCGILGVCVHDRNRAVYVCFLVSSTLVSVIVFCSPCAPPGAMTRCVQFLSLWIAGLSFCLLAQQSLITWFLFVARRNEEPVASSIRVCQLGLYTPRQLRGLHAEVREQLLDRPRLASLNSPSADTDDLDLDLDPGLF